jgi:FAD/FMN-containing dehydrogenase
MGPAVNEVPPDATAFAHRRARWLLHPQAAWTNPTRDAGEQAWVGDLMEKVSSHTDEGAYLNLLSDQGSASVRHAYGDAYARLVRVKQAYDPDDVFRHAPVVALD